MAILSDYAIGTVSIAANGTVATGTGTAWNMQSFQEGDTLMVNGFVAVLSGPATSATSIPLTRPWTGGAVTNVPYRIRYMSDGSRYTAIAQALLNLLGDGTVAAFAAAGSAIDKVTYWSAAGAAALADLSPFARANVLAQTNRAGLLNAIGVSDAVTKLAPIVLDANLALSSGWTIGSTSYPTTNLPPGSSEWFIHTMMWVDGAAAVQVAYAPFTTFMLQFTRWRSSAGAWSTWQRSGGSVVGSVAQLSGVPTGSIIERGTNANGDYIKYADGTQICWGLAGPFTTVAGGSASFGVSFSAVFSAAPQALPSPLTINPHRYSTSVNITNTNAMGVSLGDNGAGGSSVQVRWLAIGRWF